MRAFRDECRERVGARRGISPARFLFATMDSEVASDNYTEVPSGLQARPCAVPE